MPKRVEGGFGEVARQTTGLRAVWFGMSFCGLIYGAVAAFVHVAQEPPPGVVVYSLGGASVLVSAMSFYIKTVLLGPPRLAQGLREGGQAAAIRLIISGYHITWGLADVSAIMGMVLGYLGAAPVIAYGLIALGSAIVLAHGPSAHTIPDLLAAAEQERLRTQV